ncbi:ribosomal protein L22/L17 [Aspergillus crustosus]
MATMAALQPYGHLIRSARTGITYVPRRTLTYTLIRRAEGENNGPDDKPNPSAFSSITNFFLGRKKKSDDAIKGKITRRPVAPQKREGDLGSDSIFAQDEAGPKITSSGRTPTSRKRDELVGEEEFDGDVPAEKRNSTNMTQVLDPRPRRRITWERRMVIRETRKRGRLSKKEQIMQAERESLSKSHWFKTSIKKLGPLARQIAGKNIDEAIVQMQFSKKKAAKDVLEHLKHAKNIAVVRSGMGLGAVGEDAPKLQPTTIVLKDGEKKVIRDPTSIYISQAWVNRGPYGYDYDYRARGVVHLMRPPYTSLSVVLKEEKSRVREWEDREAKALRQRKSKLWVQLPDRKITGQSQYYSW